jgi:ATP-dependent DNA helicase RecG
MDSSTLLKNVLLLEAKKGFNNKAVVGGIEKFIQKNIDKTPLKKPDLEKVRRLFSNYSSLTKEERGKIINETLNLLDGKPSFQEKFIPVSETFVPVQYVKGVGPKLAKVLKKLGIIEAADLMYYFPRDYLDLSNVSKIVELNPNEQATVKGKIIRVEEKRARIKLIIVTITDRTGYLKAVWFNQPYLKDFFKEGQTVVFSGKVQYSYGRWEMPSPEYEIVQEGKELIHTMRIIPIYSLTQGISQKTIRTKIKTVLDIYTPYLLDFMEDEILQKYSMPHLSEALQNIHFPNSFPALEKAKDRLIFDELFMLQVILGMRKKEIKEKKGIKFSCSKKDIEKFEKLLPFTPTRGQKKAMADIVKDVSSGKPMNRLLHGDVGSGKTIVSLFALYLSVKNGYQGAMMSPTEILAQQTFRVAKEILEKAGIKTALLTSGTGKKNRKEILEKIANGCIDILIGTHAIIQEDVKFKNLALNVVDEQHRFGVMQRGVLREKAEIPHTLVMSATPIPRTLALTLYGDLDISQIREMPEGRKPVITKVYAGNFIEPYSILISELEKGHKGYIVCPLVEESEKSELQSVQEKIKELKATHLKNFKLGLMYGGLSSDEKKKIMGQFKQGKIDVLVSTTVIEVGVDVPDATVIIIEDADHFGLATLHQLRGRVGRSSYQSYCFLLTRSAKEDALKRLQVLEKTNNGFEVSEADLKMRGPGELFGLKQHGLPEFKITSLLREKDLEILEIARKEALNFVNNKIQWDNRKKEELVKILKKKFGDKVSMIEVA